MTRKRSTYRPRQIIHDTMRYVTTGFKPLVTVGDENIKLRLRNHTALESVLKGTGTQVDIDTLIAAANMSTALKRVGFGDDYAGSIRGGVDAVETLRNRGRESKRWVCTGPEIVAIKLLMEIHDAQLDAVTISDLDEALQHARRGQAVAV